MPAAAVAAAVVDLFDDIIYLVSDTRGDVVSHSIAVVDFLVL